MIGVRFDSAHTYTDWKLLLTEKEIGLPEPKTNIIDIPGADGVLDLTETLTGGVRYGNRTLKFSFTTTDNLSGEQWPALLTKISTALHGQRKVIVLDDDPDWTYEGRCVVDEFATSKAARTIVISCDCDPYKTNGVGEKSL